MDADPEAWAEQVCAARAETTLVDNPLACPEFGVLTIDVRDDDVVQALARGRRRP